MSFFKLRWLSPVWVMVVACDTDSSTHEADEVEANGTVHGNPSGDGDGNEDRKRNCTTQPYVSIPIRDLLSEDLNTNDDDLAAALCDQACSRAVDEISENTGHSELLTCEVDRDLVRECQAHALGGAAGAPNADCESGQIAVSARCSVEYACTNE